MDTISGLPAHPLLVHVPIVLVPLCAVAVIAMAIRPAWRDRFGVAVAGLVSIAGLFSLLAAEAGEALERHVRESDLVETHASGGDTFKIIAVLFAIAVVAWIVVAWKKMSANLELGARIVAVVLALVATVTVINVGHSGAKASWHDVDMKSTPRGGEGDGDGDHD